MKGLPVTAEETGIITSFMRRIRKLMDETAVRRRRPLLVAARVPDTLQLAANIGLDVETWL